MVNAVLSKPTIKIIFSQVGGTVILFRREEYAAHVASMVVMAIESATAFVLWLALLFIACYLPFCECGFN